MKREAPEDRPRRRKRSQPVSPADDDLIRKLYEESHDRRHGPPKTRQGGETSNTFG